MRTHFTSSLAATKPDHNAHAEIPDTIATDSRIAETPELLRGAELSAIFIIVPPVRHLARQSDASFPRPTHDP